MPRKPLKGPQISRSGREWHARKLALLQTFAPSIYCCRSCNSPVAEGYACTWCGESDPKADKEE